MADAGESLARGAANNEIKFPTRNAELIAQQVLKAT
jgi:hypothetical protein